MKLENKKIFITGATRGIGLALARQLAENHNSVVVGGRNQTVLDKLNQTDPKLQTLLFDALDDDSLNHAYQFLEKEFGKLDVLINNAAIMYAGNFEKDEFDFHQIDREIATNVSSPVKLTKALLPLLEKKGKSAIVNISSAVAYLPMISLPVYSATKAALHSFSISLRETLEQTNIEVFEAMPPLVATDMTQNLPGKAKNMKMISPEECAKFIVKGMERNKHTINIGGSTKSLAFASKLFPKIVQKQLNKM